MECPATPERLDQCPPSTPDFEPRPIKSPDPTSSSDDNTSQTESHATSSSPPPNCAICLGKCKNKCFTDSCLHQFCFRCLLEWSKVKAECPLCKQCFKSIIHNVKSDDQFEEYLVQSQPSGFPDFSRPMQAHLQIPSLDFLSMFFYPDEYPSAFVRTRSISTRFRRFVYDGGLYALPLPDFTGRFRECSARFYRENPSQTHRLMPWINRELVCLLRDSNHSATTVLVMINDLLTIFNINSPDFRRRLAPFLGHYTAHFIHEFHNFARSPFDMIGYDREVRYAVNSNDEVVINGTTSSSDGIEIGENLAAPIDVTRFRNRRRHHHRHHNHPAVELTIETTNHPRTALSSVHIVIGDNDNNNTNNTNSTIPSSSTQVAAINLSCHNHGNDENVNGTASTSNNAPEDLDSTQRDQLPITAERISLESSNSSDECEFVLERKPPHLRTPEYVSLNSESDSDVVFVSENKNPQEVRRDGPLPGTSGVSFPVNRSTRLRSSYARGIRGIFIPSSEIDPSSDSDYKPPLEVKPHVCRKLRPRQSARLVKDELSQQPSTSTGITSRGKPASLFNPSTSRRPRRKKSSYSKPKSSRNYNRPCGGRGYKAIYESSSDSDSERHESDDDDHDSCSSDGLPKTSTSDKDLNDFSSINSSVSDCSSIVSSMSSCSNSNSDDQPKPSTSQNFKSASKNQNKKKKESTGSKANSASSEHAYSKRLLGNKNSYTTKRSDSVESSDSCSYTSKNGNIKIGGLNSPGINERNENNSIEHKQTNQKRQGNDQKKSARLLKKSKNKSEHSTHRRGKKESSYSKSKTKKSSKKSKKSKSHDTSSTVSPSRKRRNQKNKKTKDKVRDEQRRHRRHYHHYHEHQYHRPGPSATEFSVSDAEPLSKQFKICKNEFLLNENEISTSDPITDANSGASSLLHHNEEIVQQANVDTEQYHEIELIGTRQQQEQLLEQQELQNATIALLCLQQNDDYHLPINLSTTGDQANSHDSSSSLLLSNNLEEISSAINEELGNECYEN